MSDWLKYVIPVASAMVLMLAVRTLVVSTHRVTGDALAPLYQDGDLLLVNRCSYGLRIEGRGLLPYSRLLKQPVKRGDVVLFSLPGDSIPGLFIARCAATPGDTVSTAGNTIIVPGLVNCSTMDYYWLEAINKTNPVNSRHLGLIPEKAIIGQVVDVLYHTKSRNTP